MSSGSDPATILVVEDDAVLGQVLGQILTQDGHVVRQAQNATEALDLLKEWSPRLVLLDAGLRNDSGLKLAEELRTRFAGLPIILLTASPASESDFPGWAAGRLLSKSINLPDLRRIVAAALAAEKPPLAVVTERQEVATPTPLSQRSEVAGRPERRVKESSMRLVESKYVKSVAVVVVAVLVLVALAAANGTIPLPGAAQPESVTAAPGPQSTAAVELVTGDPHTLYIPEDVRTALGIRKGGVDLLAVAHKPTWMRPLVMPGSTLLDPTRILRIRALFAPSPSSAQVIEIGQIKEDPGMTGTGQTATRELRSGDHVIKGDLLAAFYSVDVGNKKNDLIDAIFQLKLDKQIFEAAENKSAAVPAVFLWNYEKNVQSDINLIDRAVNTLRTWGISEEEIQAVRDEADKIKPGELRKRLKQHTKAEFDRWARVEIKAPDDGIIIERNVGSHDTIADNTINLFQIAKLDPGGAGPRLTVTANCPEDALPLLDALPVNQRRWTIKTVGSPPLHGFIDDISLLIDPNQHTGVVKGHIDNKEGRIRGTQFADATVQLPPPKDVVEVPANAVIDDGQQSIVFVQTDAAKQYYTIRRVELTNRFDKTVFVRSKPFRKGEEITPEEIELGMLPKRPLLPNERVLQSGVGELKTALLDRESQPQNRESQLAKKVH
jgi:cobalt-zinc-cadmium efflux system membrane fusion protein